MERKDGEIGLGAEARIALAFIGADAERRRVLELPPMRIVCFASDSPAQNDAIRDVVSMTRDRVAHVPGGEIRFIGGDPCAVRGLRADVVIALRGGVHPDVVAALLAEPGSLGIRVVR